MLYRASKGPYFAPIRPHITTELRPIFKGRKMCDRREFSYPFYCVFGVDLLYIVNTENVIYYESK